MKLYFKKRAARDGYEDALIAIDEDTAKWLSKMTAAQSVILEYRKPRNVQFHRKFMALVNLVFENQDKYTNKEHLLTELKLQVGHYEEHVTLGGRLVFKPKSISFGSMDEDEFREFYSKSVDVVLRFFLKGMTEEELNVMVDQVLGFV